jgi:hypothetical protein
VSAPTTDLTVSNNTITFDTAGPGALEFWGIALQDLNNALIYDNVIGPLDYSVTNRAIGVGVILSNNHQPDGTPIPGL